MKKRNVSTYKPKWLLGTSRITKEEINYIARIFTKFPKTLVTDLVLHANHLQDDSIVTLAEALKTNESITLLWIPDNKYGETGCTALAEMLAENKSLTKLCMFGHQLGMKGAVALSNALKVNVTLKELNIPRMWISPLMFKIILDGVAENKTLQKLFVANNEFGFPGIHTTLRWLIFQASKSPLIFCVEIHP
jgi:Ran GTPase-activating protein (RanGAP) involved in mRNA processing and transport